MINTLRDLYTEEELHAMLKDGIAVLRELMTDEKAGQETRRRAADSLLKHLNPTMKEKRSPPREAPRHDPENEFPERPSTPSTLGDEQRCEISDDILREMLDRLERLNELGLLNISTQEDGSHDSDLSPSVDSENADHPAPGIHHQHDPPPAM